MVTDDAKFKALKTIMDKYKTSDAPANVWTMAEMIWDTVAAYEQAAQVESE